MTHQQMEAAAARAAAAAVQQALAQLGVRPKSIAKPHRPKPKPRAPPVPPPAPPAPPPAPPPSSRGRTIKRKERFGDAGELDGAARAFRTAPLAPKSPVPLSHETSVPAFALPGNGQLWALGWHGGVRQWFKAEVVALRVRFPRVHVRFVEDAHGSTHKLALPTPVEAYVHAGMLLERDWD
jgi:hypothetical protein